MVTSQAHEIPNANNVLDTVALRLHSKTYRLLNDTEACAVWDVIEADDSRTCQHHATFVDCDCDTIAAELAGQD
jgi:hypothetical protein